MPTIANEVRSAIRSAVEEAGQPDDLAEKLIAWMERIASGAESVTDEESVRRHLDVLMEAVEIEAVSEEE